MSLVFFAILRHLVLQGPHKGPVKRWDFDNEDDYSTYQSSREAVPKYALDYCYHLNPTRFIQGSVPVWCEDE